MAARLPSAPRFLHEFLGSVLVRCPACDGLARSVAAPDTHPSLGARRLTCLACGAQRESPGGVRLFRDGRDPHFGLPLFLATPCCGDVLWAYGPGHLDFLEAFVGARHRERRRSGSAWSNGSLQSRLPRWMKDAKHRPTLLAAIRKLRASLPDDAGDA